MAGLRKRRSHEFAARPAIAQIKIDAAGEQLVEHNRQHIERIVAVSDLRLAPFHRGQRGFTAERHVAVGMAAVEQLDERAIGDRARHVAKLREPVQAQLADALEIRFEEMSARFGGTRV